MNTLAQFAEQYAANRFHVLPLPPCKKAPPPTGWNTAPAMTVEAVRAHWTAQPEANIGLAMGRGVVAIDVDGPTGEASLEALVAELGPLPATLTARTPGKGSGPGRHLLFTTTATIKSAVAVATGIDVRSTGGYIVAAPSIHPNGGAYEWIDKSPIATLPEAWATRLASKPHGAKASAGEPVHGALPSSLAECCALLRATEQGARNDTLSRVAFKAGAQLWAGAREALREAIAGWDPAYLSAHHDTIDRQLAAGEKRAPIVLGSDLHRIVDEAAERLGLDPDLFSRDGQLVTVFQAQGLPDMGDGAPIVRTVSDDALRDRLSAVCSFARVNAEGETRLASPPREVIGALGARGRWSVPPLVGIVETPCLRPDGSVLLAAGYDQATGLYHVPSLPPFDVPDRPTQGEANAAANEFAELFRDFPFVDPKQCVVPIAALLTLLARPAIEGPTPAFLFDASTRGSGKTLLARVVAILATGRDLATGTFPKDEAEQEKVLGALALTGARLACFDNIPDGEPFGGAPIDRVLTAFETSFRVLGKSEQRTLPWRAVVMATGNNVVSAKDTARRVLVARLEPSVERPEARTNFQHKDLCGFVRENRARLVRAGLVMLRAAHVANAQGSTIGSFEAWARVVGGAVTFATGVDLGGVFATAGGDDPETAATRALFTAFGQAFPNGATSREIAGAINAAIPPPPVANVREQLEALGLRTPATALGVGAILRRVVGRRLGEMTLRAFTGHGGHMRWAVRGDLGDLGGGPASPSHT